MNGLSSKLYVRWANELSFPNEYDRDNFFSELSRFSIIDSAAFIRAVTLMVTLVKCCNSPVNKRFIVAQIQCPARASLACAMAMGQPAKPSMSQMKTGIEPGSFRFLGFISGDRMASSLLC